MDALIAPELGRQALRVVIPGEPVAQGRPRVAVIAGRPRVYDPAVSRSWKAMARSAMAAASPSVLLYADGPVAVTIRAFHTCARSAWRKRAPLPRRWRDSRPDAENIAKAVLDAATGVIWRDDAQVARLVIEQYTAAQGEAPRVEVEVSALPVYISEED